MNVAQNRDNWRAVVNTVRIFGLHKMRNNFGSFWNYEVLKKKYDTFVYLLWLQEYVQLLSQTFFYTLKPVNKATV